MSRSPVPRALSAWRAARASVTGRVMGRAPCHHEPMRSPRPEHSGFGHLRRVGVAALIALSLGLVVVVVGEGFSTVGAVRALEDIALGVIVAALLMGAAAFAAVRLAGWRDPESETEFE